MIALIKKDIYLVGKQTWLLLAIVAGISFTPQFEGFGGAYLMVLTITLPVTTLAYDERCRWDTFLSMTPCRPERVVFSKYLFTAGLAAAATALVMLISWLRTVISGADYAFVEILAERLSLLVVMLTVNAVTLPTIFRFGVEKGRLTMMAMMFSIFAIIVGGSALIGEETMFGWMDRIPLPVLGVAAAAVIAAVNIASFFLSVRFYKRRLSGVYG